MRKLVLIALVGLSALALRCGGSEISQPDAVTEFDAIEKDGDTTLPDMEILTNPEAEGLLEFEIPPQDDGTDVLPPDTDDTTTCNGDPGCPCTQPSDCKTGVCVEEMDGFFCGEPCVDKCTGDDKCSLIHIQGGDTAYFCIPKFPNLCKPCTSNDDCKTTYSTDADLCVDGGPAGNFCGGDCGGGTLCPEGFVCQTINVPNGGTAKQCVPANDTCFCTPKYIGHQDNTACYIKNQWGQCDGNRYCSADGLTECDALEPKEEACNGQDDNCDGLTDTDIASKSCEVTNQWGTCKGYTVCEAGKEKCQAKTPEQEKCDGVDSNCDGLTDTEYPDTNDNGIPDCLEDDDDGDGITDNIDNCPQVWNKDQANYDKDFEGDACDADDDNDGVMDTMDCEPLNADIYPGNAEVCDGVDNNCNDQVDENFTNTDGDSLKDCIDPDDDNDGILDALDNCPLAYNPAQVNTDKDSAGDVCDPDDDNDTIADDMDNCPLIYNTDQKDNEKDGIGDPCDPDDDNDSVADGEDNCNLLYNADQANFDKDDKGDACDPDIDNDGELNETDCDDYNAQVNHYMPEVCNEIDDNCVSGVDEQGAVNCKTMYKDVDKDTFGTDENKCLCGPSGDFSAEKAGDCKDNNPLINPAMQEKCSNGVDDNCDSNQNDQDAVGCKFFFFDQDADGYGTDQSRCYCVQEGDWRANVAGDCDDNNANINPGAQENCNTPFDENCNNILNEDNALGSVQFYHDGDQDTFGITTDYRKLCAADGVYSALKPGDCDDNNPFVNPNQKEKCDAGKVDENCNGAIDEENAEGCSSYYYDGDHDGYGLSGNFKCLCGPDVNFSTTEKADCNDNDAAIHPFAPEICNNVDDNCDLQKDNAGITELCGAFDQSHATATCDAGQCKLQCSASWFNVDHVFNTGCECQDDSWELSGNGDSCNAAIDVGDLADDGKTLNVSGNLPDEGDWDYYKVRAIDNPEAGAGGCDTFSFHVRFVDNPDDAFRLKIFKGTACAGSEVKCEGDVSYTFYTDYRETPAASDPIGECPCSNLKVDLPAPPTCADYGKVPPVTGISCYDTITPEPVGTMHLGTQGANYCQDDTAYFIVGVYRLASKPATCGYYKLELSNGVYVHH